MWIALAVLAADLSGIWTGRIPSGRNGDLQDIAFQIVQDGTKLKGKLYGDYTSTPIVEGYIAGDLVTFVVSTREQSGNEINASRVRFTGRLLGSDLELTREREQATNAGNSGGAAPLRPGSKPTFRLTRMVGRTSAQ